MAVPFAAAGASVVTQHGHIGIARTVTPHQHQQRRALLPRNATRRERVTAVFCSRDAAATGMADANEIHNCADHHGSSNVLTHGSACCNQVRRRSLQTTSFALASAATRGGLPNLWAPVVDVLNQQGYARTMCRGCGDGFLPFPTHSGWLRPAVIATVPRHHRWHRPAVIRPRPVHGSSCEVSNLGQQERLPKQCPYAPHNKEPTQIAQL